MFAPACAFVDLETTGTTATGDRGRVRRAAARGAADEVAAAAAQPAAAPQGFDLDIYRIISGFFGKPSRNTRLIEFPALRAAA